MEAVPEQVTLDQLNLAMAEAQRRPLLKMMDLGIEIIRDKNRALAEQAKREERKRFQDCQFAMEIRRYKSNLKQK